MLLGDIRKKNINNKLIIIAAIGFLPMVFMFVSVTVISDVNILILIFIIYFIFATSIAFYLLNMMKKEKTALKGMKAKVISLEYKLDLEVDKKGNIQQFYPKEYYKDGVLNSDVIPLLTILDENEVYEIVIISLYYYCVIKNQFGQSYLVHTNNLKLIE
ncbi:hypothetical protein [Mariniplasma anaerobium]|uniref:Uncharacterized protein n=1 Tax=Mariniplasma anaerobium TaxID=2735436 RepID=A0A7U9XVN2_9MOLU|nr:hypothetical protein [Mariniplasma anaerobium]BCR36565.1 hypothetical protein MPAN_014580 [Mariniplasma anaerobium]